jgi:hypothetical protein
MQQGLIFFNTLKYIIVMLIMSGSTFALVLDDNGQISATNVTLRHSYKI